MTKNASFSLIMNARLSRINADFEVIKGAAIGYAYNHPIVDASGVVVAYALANTIGDLGIPADTQKDPWSNAYVYVRKNSPISWASASAEAFTLSSHGADGVAGNDDIVRQVYESEVLSHLK